MPWTSAPIPLPDDAATAALARRLAPVLHGGDVLALEGPVGAGKSTFARALIRHYLGPNEDVPSPTFTLVQSYEAPGFEIWHCDLYRLGHPDEVLELGLSEAFETALCLIEWPDRMAGDLPGDALHLALATEGDGRRATLHSADETWRERIAHVL